MVESGLATASETKRRSPFLPRNVDSSLVKVSIVNDDVGSLL